MTLSLITIDSSTLAHEVVRRIESGLLTPQHSMLFHTQTFTLHNHRNARRDGVKMKPGTKRMASLKFDVSNENLLRELESRIYGGSHYALREFTRAFQHSSKVQVTAGL
jgi:hypothetical protein